MVRVNALDSGLIESDLASIVGPDLNVIMLPKTQTAWDLRLLHSFLLAAEKVGGIAPNSMSLVALIETALALENAYGIATANSFCPRLHTLAFGAADFCLDMGMKLSKRVDELIYARSRILVTCRAARIKSLFDTPYMVALNDREALKADNHRGKALGFGGKLCIHPNQVDLCNRMFSPTEQEI